ncbi:hypothetical protein M8J76_007663 [Diaphorina citri]|nr:hypothetical protein M8J76_007663 [Diaphorina citri]
MDHHQKWCPLSAHSDWCTKRYANWTLALVTLYHRTLALITLYHRLLYHVILIGGGLPDWTSSESPTVRRQKASRKLFT